MGEKNGAWGEALGSVGPELLQGAEHFVVLLLEIELLHELFELGQDSFKGLRASLVALNAGQSCSVLDIEGVS